jgi:hypothetical protein
MIKFGLVLSFAFVSLFAIEIKECQHYDSFFKKCRYEKTIIQKGNISCEQKCQHWDKTFKKCRYETSCEYNKKDNLFIYKECQHWDKTFKKCKYEKTKIIKEEKDLNNQNIIIINN